MSVKKQELWNIIETLPNETSNKVIDNVEDLKFSYVIDQAPRKLVIRSKKDLREKLEEGIKDSEEGNVCTVEEAFSEIEEMLAN